MQSVDALKQAAAVAAVAEVQNGMLLGLGTGSTAAFAIEAVAERVRAGLRIEAVATSERSAELARAAGLQVLDFGEIARVDLCIDGVDEIDADLRAIKGGGGAMLREKIVATSATRMIAIADASKQVTQLGARPVPVEVLPFARSFVAAQIATLGGAPKLRFDSSGAAVLTDQGNQLLDCAFQAIVDPASLATALSGIPGLLGHGLFLDEIDSLILATEAGIVRRDR